MKYASIVRDDGITFIIDQRTYKVMKTDTIFNKVREAHEKEDVDELRKILNLNEGLINFAEGSVKIEDGVVSWHDQEIDNALTKRMVKMMQEGYSISPMIKFMDNLMENPSSTSVKELYIFMDHNELPITDDGHFVAYKKVRKDYMDIYTGKFDNSVGQVLEIRRNEVDDQRNNTCSYGLHFCSKDYLRSYGANDSGARVMIVKINPRDVVSIPSDYNNAKGRTCRYEVINEWDEWYQDHKKGDGVLEETSVYSTRLKESVDQLNAERDEFDDAYSSAANRIAELMDDENSVDVGSMPLNKVKNVINTVAQDRTPVKQDVNGNWRDAAGRFTYAPEEDDERKPVKKDVNGNWRDKYGRFTYSPS